jgi:hypothetical protein
LPRFGTLGKTAEDELARQKAKADHVEQLERDREALLNHYARIVPEQLDALEPEERNRIYKMLDLTVLAHENGSLELKWALGADPCRDNEPLPDGVLRLQQMPLGSVPCSPVMVTRK